MTGNMGWHYESPRLRKNPVENVMPAQLDKRLSMLNPILAAIYILAMVTANILVWWLGPWFSPINSFILIGLDLTLRDVMHGRVTRWQLAGIITIGGILTLAINPSASTIAIASATAFLAAATVDWVIYEVLIRHHWLVRSNGSNVAGAAVDSVLFPTIAFGMFLPHIIVLQFAAKVGGGFIWSLILRPLTVGKA